MQNIETFTAEKILGIAVDEPQVLFTGNLDTAKAEFRRLAKIWHPDLAKSDADKSVFPHLHALFDKAKDRLESGAWVEADITLDEPNVLLCKAVGGKAYRLRFQSRRAFELGEILIAKTTLTYIVRKSHEALFKNAIKVIEGLAYPDDKMRAEFGPRLPRIKKTIETANNFVLILEKSQNLHQLGDVLETLGGKMAAEHVAWVINTILNIACYLDFSKLTHNAISLDTVFIDPEAHDGALLGGWWYAAPTGVKLASVPPRTYNLMPADTKAAKRADHRIDLDLIRCLARELLGDALGSKLIADKTIPASISTWIRLVSAGSAIGDYRSWTETLTQSYGKRRFVVLPIDTAKIYS